MGNINKILGISDETLEAIMKNNIFRMEFENIEYELEEDEDADIKETLSFNYKDILLECSLFNLEIEEVESEKYEKMIYELNDLAEEQARYLINYIIKEENHKEVMNLVEDIKKYQEQFERCQEILHRQQEIVDRQQEIVDRQSEKINNLDTMISAIKEEAPETYFLNKYLN